MTKSKARALAGQQPKSGFTLIELVMVIMILAIVAGLAVPIVGWLRRSANYAAQANTQAAIGTNLEFFRTTFGNNGYPDRFDSLIVAAGEDGAADIIPDTDEGGYLDHGFEFLQAGQLDADEVACLNFLDNVVDHYGVENRFNGLQGSPSNSADATQPGFVREVDDDGAGNNFAIAFDQDLGTGGIIDTGSNEQALMLSEFYPDGVPDDVRLVAFGVGPNNEAIGRTIQSTPIDPRVDPSEVYGRYVAVFAVYSPRAGRRAQLKGVLNAFGRTNNNAISEFWSSFAPE